MIVSESLLKWAMRFYPPLLFQRIWTIAFDTGFYGVYVKIGYSLINRNFNRSIFGGTIFSASDPFHLILLHQILQRRNYKVKLWLKGAHIEYLKPGNCDLYFRISLSDEDIEEVLQKLDNDGKFIKTFPVKITNRKGELYAMVYNELYIKLIAS